MVDPTARPRAIITGASSGIGAELARQLAATHDLVLVARRRERLDALAAELAAPGRSHLVIALDLSTPGADEALFAEVPSCDLLLNNAGFGLVRRFVASEPARLAEMLDLNVRVLTLLTRRYLPGMIERGRGGVLNVGSVAAWLTSPGMGTYCATKSYVVPFTEALRHELLGTGVHATALCPGPTTTEFVEVSGMDAERRFGRTLHRIVFASAADVARAGLRGIARNRRVVIPGWLDWATVHLSNLAPRWITLAIAGRLLR